MLRFPGGSRRTRTTGRTTRTRPRRRGMPSTRRTSLRWPTPLGAEKNITVNYGSRQRDGGLQLGEICFRNAEQDGRVVVRGQRVVRVLGVRHEQPGTRRRQVRRALATVPDRDDQRPAGHQGGRGLHLQPGRLHELAHRGHEPCGRNGAPRLVGRAASRARATARPTSSSCTSTATITESLRRSRRSEPTTTTSCGRTARSRMR